MSLRLPPVGFWSYATQDDQKKLSELRVRLSELLQRLYGRDHVGIFQDVFAIPPGAEWEEKIRDALSSSSFFIPIITPNFLESEWCNREFFEFRKREDELRSRHPALHKTRLTFPIYYLDISGIKPLNPALLTELDRLQRLSFEDLIFKSIDDEEVQKRLDRLARSLRTVLQLELEPQTVSAPAPPEVLAPAFAGQGSSRTRSRRTILLTVAGLAIVAALGWGLYQGGAARRAPPESTQPLASAPKSLQVTFGAPGDDYVKGSAYETWPRAAEYSPQDIRYTWHPISELPSWQAFLADGPCLSPKSIVIWLFEDNKMKRVQVRLAKDTGCDYKPLVSKIEHTQFEDGVTIYHSGNQFDTVEISRVGGDDLKDVYF